jgi:hypothetical protein
VSVGVLVGVYVGVEVGVLVGVCVAVGIAVGVSVGVEVGVFVDVDVGVAVGVCVGVAVGVYVGVEVGVLVGVSVDVGVKVGVGVGVSVAVGVNVGVLVGVFVGIGVNVGVFVAVAVGVDVRVAVGVGVEGADCDSYAPMSQCAPCGRVRPFCEVLFTGAAAQTVSSPASIATLPAFNAIVSVEPPLSANEPRLSAPDVVCVKLEPQVSSLARLLEPVKAAAKKQFPPDTLLAMIMLCNTRGLPAIPPPLLSLALLPDSVLLITVSELLAV